MFFIEYVPINEETMNIAPCDDERKILSTQIEYLRNTYSDMNVKESSILDVLD